MQRLNLVWRKPWRYLAIALMAAAALYGAWAELTRTRGSQAVTFVPAKQECAIAGPLRYCVNRAVGGTNGDFVYHLHGRGLDEQIWNDDTYFTAMLQARWQETRVLPPTVISISYGPTWLLTPKGRKPDSGLLDDLMIRMPEIEARVGAPRRRMLMGESMGGLNVLIAGLSYPARFTKVAALCPGVYADSPFDSLGTLWASMGRTGASPKIIAGIWLLARQYVGDADEWQRISPLSLIERAGPGTPALYLSCGLYDAYGNYEGTQRLAEAARRRGVSAEWHPLYGGHCAVDVDSLTEFLAK
ncbi:esterase [Roseateles aquatilis]|uniref:Esterase n=1 Tax=Roseateles aquatilis TaxID=431061 RepID=A0A2D0AM34_9BURK|nr:alpha/beta hydrolase-fold protein [Roseateles aquatilis]OWQ85291.1 esterase [Roseateles aquatilis]